MRAKAETIDEYLAALPAAQRKALEALRKAIHAAAPRAQECITYRLPAFRLDGKVLVAFGATPNHCALYPMSARTVENFEDDLEGYDTSKGTIRFQPETALPAALVRRLVKLGSRRTEGNRRHPASAARGARSAAHLPPPRSRSSARALPSSASPVLLLFMTSGQRKAESDGGSTSVPLKPRRALVYTACKASTHRICMV
jgi:uncharacterized protein YdhG (YjbR/CyaY superfamily)